jgi:NAD(P)-dependent dehydrogenase (short-subunit alcohol dehydrogenase family)
VELLGGLDVLVLNHIVAHSLGPWLQIHDNYALMDLIFDVNFKSYVRLTTSAMTHLAKTSGRIVVMSSVAGVYK